MSNLIYNGVDVFNPIEGKREEIIKYFVNFYGEEYRQRIEKAYDNTTFLFLPKFNGEESITKMYLEYEIKMKLKSKFQEALNDYTSLIGYENIFLFEPVSLHFTKKNLLEDKYVDGDDAEIINAFARKLNLCSRKSFDLKKEFYSKKAKQKIALLIDLYIENYNIKYKQNIDELNQIMKQLINSIESNLPDVNKIENKLENEINALIDDYFYKLVSKLEDSRENLNREEYKNIFRDLIKQESLPAPVFTTDEQKKQYAHLLKYLGYDFGADYYDIYAHKKLFENIIFEKTLIDELKKLYKNKKESLIKENKYLKDAYSKLSKTNLTSKNISTSIYDLMYDFVYSIDGVSGWVYPYIDSESEQLKYICVCGDYFSTSTSTFVHEFNHIIRMNLISNTKDVYKVKCGLDIISYAKTDCGKLMCRNTRNANALDEIINEWDSEEIVCKMEKDNFFVGNSENRVSIYRKGFIPFSKFILENNQKIFDASMSNNSRALIEYLGVEDFFALCNLAKETLEIEGTSKVIREARKKLKNKNIRLREIAEYFLKKKILLSWSKEAENIYEYTHMINKYTEKLKNAEIENDKSNLLVANKNEFEK